MDCLIVIQVTKQNRASICCPSFLYFKNVFRSKHGKPDTCIAVERLKAKDYLSPEV